MIRYLLSDRVRQTAKITGMAVSGLVVTLLAVYHLFLSDEIRSQVDVAYYAGLNKLGLASKEEIDLVQNSLHQTEATLIKTKKENEELAKMMDRMIRNNKVAENFKHIVKRIYDDPRTVYTKTTDRVDLKFGKNRIARYQQDPEMWYLLGVLDTDRKSTRLNSSH